MACNRIKVYWLLLLVLIFTASVLMSIGESQARYENTVLARTVVESGGTGVTSNCLVTENDAPLTILVGQIPLYNTTKVSFWLRSADAAASGKLAWSVSDEDHADYLNISMLSGNETIEPNAEIELLKDVYMDITMTLTPTETARSTVHEAMKINILVTWGEEMWGTFQVILPAVQGESGDETESSGEQGNTSEDPELISSDNNGEPDEEEKESEEGGSDGENPQSTDTASSAESPAETGNAEIVEEEATAETVTESTTEPATEASTESTTEAATEATTESTTESTTEETTEPSVEETTEATTEPSTEPPTEPETEPATEPEEEEEPKTPIRLETITRFDPAEKLPVKVVLTEDVTSIRLGLWVEEEVKTEETEETEELEEWEEWEEPDETEESEETEPVETVLVLKPFPDYTKFSLNQGESYYMMYDGYIAEFSLQGTTALSVLLDFSHTELDESEKLMLGMEVYAEDELLTTCQVNTTPDAREAFQTVSHTLLQQAALVETESTTTQAETGDDWENRILNLENVLEFTLPMEWLDAELEYSVEMLTMTENQTLEYVPVTLSAQGLYAKYTDYDLTHNLVLQIGETLPQAGTYRLNMKWSYEGICYAHTQTTFFINYSAHTTYTLGS